jgi:SAM-dependent methyltransferase
MDIRNERELMLEIRHENMTKTDTVQEAYNKIFVGEGIQHLDSFYLWLIRLLNPKVGATLLDISCGQGRMITLANGLGLRAIGVDFAINGIRIGYQDAPEAGWVVGNGQKLPFANHCVDYVMHIGSLEHYLDPFIGAREIARVLKPHGTACVLLPNAFGLLGNVRHVSKTGEIFDDGQPLQRYATRKTWEKLLSDGGLKVDKTIKYGEVVFPKTFNDAKFMLNRPNKILRYLVNLFIPLNLSNHIVYICRRL